MKNFKRGMLSLGALSLAAALGSSAILPIFGVNNDTNTKGYVPVTKTVNKQAGVAMPQADVTFTVSPVTTSGNDKNSGIPVSSGIQGAFEPAGTAGPYTKNFTFTIPKATPDAKTDGQDSVTYGNYKLQVTNPDVFQSAGIYRYQLTENAPTFNGFAPTPNTTNTYFVDVYVVNNTTTNKVEVDDLLVWKAGAAAGSIDGKANICDFQNTYTTNLLTVKKQLAGNSADMNAKFPFVVSITPDEATDIFYVKTFAADGNTVMDTYTVTSKGTGTAVTQTVELGQNQSVKVYGLTSGDQYSVTEDQAASTGAGYTVSIAQDTKGGGNADTVNAANRTISGTTADGADGFIFTNTRKQEVPTGFFITYAPYLAGLAVLGGLGYAMLRKKKAAE